MSIDFIFIKSKALYKNKITFVMNCYNMHKVNYLVLDALGYPMKMYPVSDKGNTQTSYPFCYLYFKTIQRSYTGYATFML